MSNEQHHERRTHDGDTLVTRAELERRLEAGRVLMMGQIDSRFDTLEKLIKSGFPGGEPGKHREVHEGYIVAADDRRDLWKSVREKTTSGIVWAVLLLLALAVWEYIKVGVQK